MHIPADLRNAYVRRDLPPRLLAALETHVEHCRDCANGVASAPLGAAHWVRRGLLGRLVQIAAPSPEPVAEQELRRAA